MVAPRSCPRVTQRHHRPSPGCRDHFAAARSSATTTGVPQSSASSATSPKISCSPGRPRRPRPPGRRGARRLEQAGEVHTPVEVAAARALARRRACAHVVARDREARVRCVEHGERVEQHVHALAWRQFSEEHDERARRNPVRAARKRPRSGVRGTRRPRWGSLRRGCADRPPRARRAGGVPPG